MTKLSEAKAIVQNMLPDDIKFYRNRGVGLEEMLHPQSVHFDLKGVLRSRQPEKQMFFGGVVSTR